MKYINIVQELYNRLPFFRQWPELKSFSLDDHLPYFVFSGLANYLYHLVSKEKKDDQDLLKINEIASFLEEMSLSDDKEVRYLFADFPGNDVFSGDKNFGLLLDYLKPNSKKIAIKIRSEVPLWKKSLF